MPSTQLQVGIPGGDQRIPIPEPYQNEPPLKWIPVHGVSGCGLRLRRETASLDEVIYDWVGPKQPEPLAKHVLTVEEGSTVWVSPPGISGPQGRGGASTDPTAPVR